MNLVLFLPGFSVRNKEEGGNIVEKLKESGYQIYFHQWRHWDNPEIKFSVEEELKLIDQALSSQSFKNITLVSKSIGTYVSTQFLKQGKYDVLKIVLMGIPFNDINYDRHNEYVSVLNNFNGSITIIHNRNDSHGTLEDIKSILESGFKHNLIVHESSEHTYNYPEDVLNILQSPDSI